MNNQKIKEKAAGLKNYLISKTSLYFDNKKDKELLRAVIKFSVSGILSSVYSFLLASTACLFGTYPLGLCLLASSSTNVLFIYIGCSAASLFIESTHSLVHIVVYTLCLLIRFAIWKWIYSDELASPFNQSTSIKSIIALICGLINGLYFCVVDGFSIYSLGGLVFVCAVSLGLTAVLSGISKDSHPLHRQVAMCAIGFCLINALASYSVFGFSLAFSACTCICLYSAMTRDMLKSTVFSLICGFACNDPVIAPMFAIMALVCALTRKFKENTALAAGVLFGIGYAFWVYGLTTLTYVIPDVICGTLPVIPIKHFINSKTDSSNDTVEEKFHDIKIQMSNAAKKDSQNLSLSLCSIASVLNELSSKLKKPDIASLQEMSKNAYCNNCQTCSLSAVCSMSFNNSSSFKNTLAIKSANALFDKGYICADDIPSRLIDSCKKSRELIYHINDQYGMLLKRLSTEDKTKAFSAGYSSISKLIDEGMDKREEEFEIDPTLSATAMGLCKELNISPKEVYIYGKRKKNVVIKGKGNLPISGNKLKEGFSNLCSCRLTNPFIENVESHWKITMESKPQIQAEMAFATKNCNGEDVCGDHVCTFTTADGYYYTVLSDGMGSGRQASLVSNICCIFAEQLSLCGGSLKTVLETINNYILNQSYECSATIDLLRIDSYTSMGYFVKSGAVSSMVIRGGHVFRISSATVPIGIVRELNSEQISLPLKSGDYIIMASDGVTPDFESGLFAADIVTKYHHLPPKEIAQKIIEAASESGRRPDDMSCAVIKINEYSNSK